SMIEGWLSNAFWKRKLPFPEGATVPHWSFPVPPGWQRIVTRPLPEICAWSWMEHHRAIQQGLERLGLQPRCVVVRYEDLAADRARTLATLAKRLGFSWTEDQENRSMQVGSSWTTVSAPRADKWRDTRAAEIETILPMISDTMVELGYR
ncbi:MAG: sulfotransferase family protein, partial [Vicinamibacteria bacterium]